MGALLFPCVFTFFVAVMVRAAWLCDDAYITFRTVDNFVNGYGLTWNTFERVQAFTHPLWMFLLSSAYAVSGEIYLTSILLGMAVSLLAVLLLCFGIARSWPGVICAVAILSLSRAFVDYTTSGLENPLTHLLLALFYGVFFSKWAAVKKVFPMALLLALGTLNRMDALLMFAPAMGWIMIEARSVKAVFLAALGLAPFALWEVFSVIYYGFPFPNTAYAKLNNGIESSLFYQQGIAYYISQAARDPLTLAIIVTAIPAPFFIKDKRSFFLSLGMLLYLLYIVRIGGDFMMGRFLTAPLFMAVMLLALLPWNWRQLPPLLLVTVGLSLLTPYPVLLNDAEYGVDRHKMPGNAFRDMRGVSDQRGFYYHATGLLRAPQNQWEAQHEWAEQGRRLRKQGRVVTLAGAVGMKGYYAGHEPIILDYHALTDPLLARLPARDKINFHIAHFLRQVPFGYSETVRSGENKIVNSEYKALYSDLKMVTQGPLWTNERWRTILKLNLRAGLDNAALPTERQTE